MFRIIRRFMQFYWSATTKYHVHSPFVFDFIENVLEDPRLFYAFHEIETIRKFLLKDHQTIQVTDLGAGSKYTKSNQREVRQIAKSALSSPAFCRKLFRIVNHYKPKQILEMGTSLGISTAYLRKGALNAQLVTLEGCPEISARAQKVFKRLKLEGIKNINGDFQQTLPDALKRMGKVDLIFFDGNHRKEPTLAYFELAMQYASEDSIFIFDDIYWSEEMLDAWEVLKADQRVRLSIDLFSMGILFFKKEIKQKQHYRLIPWWWKPWKMGFLRGQ